MRVAQGLFIRSASSHKKQTTNEHKNKKMQKKNQDKTKQIQTFGVSGIGLLRQLACSVNIFYLILLYFRV